MDITLAVKLSHAVIPTVIYRPKYRHCHLVIIAGLYSIVYRKVTVDRDSDRDRGHSFVMSVLLAYIRKGLVKSSCADVNNTVMQKDVAK